ncbi:hypothetical protein [Pseudomonas sp. S1_E04]
MPYIMFTYPHQAMLMVTICVVDVRKNLSNSLKSEGCRAVSGEDFLASEFLDFRCLRVAGYPHAGDVGQCGPAGPEKLGARDPRHFDFEPSHVFFVVTVKNVNEGAPQGHY